MSTNCYGSFGTGFDKLTGLGIVAQIENISFVCFELEEIGHHGTERANYHT
jgi:hypothetical protein